MSEQQSPEQQFIDMTRDPVRGRQLRKSLEALESRGGDPAMREMAREVLSGRLSLRDAANVPAYGEAMRQGMQQGLQAYESMSEDERRQAEEEGRRQLDEIQREMDDEQRERNDARAGGAGSAGKHGSRGWQL